MLIAIVYEVLNYNFFNVLITPWYFRDPGMIRTTLECPFGFLRCQFSFIGVLRRLWQRLSVPENLYSCRPSNKPIYVFRGLSFAFWKLESEVIGNSVMFMIRICQICIFVFVRYVYLYSSQLSDKPIWRISAVQL